MADRDNRADRHDHEQDYKPKRSAEADGLPRETTAPTAQQAENRSSSLVSASALMAAGTMVSRLFGFLRAILLAAVIANGSRQADMFALANTVPNMIYVLLAGGALNTVFVPQIVRAIKRDKDGGDAYVNRILTAMGIILGVITVVSVVAAPLIMQIYTDGAWKSPALQDHYQQMIVLAALCLPQIFFYGVHVLAGQVLNAHEKFGPMMWAPIANNVISVGVFVLYLIIWGTDTDTSATFNTAQLLVLGIGSTLGIVAQAAVLVPFLGRTGHKFQPRFDLRGVGLGHTFHLAKWTLGFVLATQLGLVVITRLASGASVSGEPAAGWNAYNQTMLVWILPHSLITVSLATAMMPAASRLAADHDLAGVAREATQTMRLALTALLPAAVALGVLCMPIAILLFGNGKGKVDAPFMGWTLLGLAIGLVPFTLNYVCQRTFYAMEDTRTPFFQQCLVVVLNVGFALALVLPFDAPQFIAPALGLAYSSAYCVGFVVDFIWLRRRLPDLDPRPLLRLGVRLTLAVAPAAIVAYGITYLWGSGDNQLVRAGSLALSGVLAVAIFVGLSRLLHIEEVTTIVSTVLRRRRAAADRSAEEPAVVESPATEIPGADSTAAARHAGPDAGARPTMQNSATGSSSEDSPGLDVSAMARSDVAAAEAHPMTLARGEVNANAELDPERPHSELPDSDQLEGHITTGTVLGRRYRLEERMEERRSVETWRAFDTVLSRSVVINLLPAGDERSPETLASARKAAIATDSRFLRILDAVESDDPEHGSYVVSEYTPGQNLTTMLAAGPLSALESAWLVREVADAMSGVHAADLHHLRISPSTIWITPTGNIKIGELAIRAELRPGPELDPGDPTTLKRGRAAFHPETEEAHDVADLGRVLYACLVHRWPGGNRFGMEAAPTDGLDGWFTPRQVRHGVSPALDRICEQILSASPRRAGGLRTASQIVTALGQVLGTADASADLERRLQHPVPQITVGDPQLIAPQSPLTAYRAQSTSDRPEILPSSPDSPQTAKLPRVSDSAPASRRWVLGMIIVLVMIIIVALIAVVTQLGLAGGRGNQEDAAPAPGPVVRKITDVTDFDPPPGNGRENPDQTRLAFDGDPETGWTTVRYLNDPQLGGLKDGVGLVVDLGAPVAVSRVKLIMNKAGTNLELRVPNDLAATDPPLTSADDWKPVAQAANAAKEVELASAEPVTARYLLVYLTALPADKGDYRGGVNEIEVSG
ncbi:MAG: murein biosynthesis integral membrane protein MurJ [Propionibacteriales bacterium]|nr:murein biosynthesis integral membrane protein MurJ [Propionibacteriales bacterium]